MTTFVLFLRAALLPCLLLLGSLQPVHPEIFNAVALATLTYSEDGASADWGVDALKAAYVAVDAVNAPTGLLGSMGHALNISAVVDTQCDPAVASAEVSSLLADAAAMAGVVGFLGPDCGEAARVTAAATAADGRGLAVVSAGATASSLSDPGDFPTFVRVVPSASLYDTSVLYAAARYAFTTAPRNRAGIVFTSPDAMGEEAATAMRTAADALGYSVVANTSFPRNSSAEVVLSAVEVLQAAGVETVIIAAPVPETRSIFAAVEALRGGGGGASTGSAWAPRALLSNEAIGAESQDDAAAIAGAQGYLTVLPDPYPLCSTTTAFAAALPGANRWATFAYDSVLLLAQAVASAAAAAAQTTATAHRSSSSSSSSSSRDSGGGGVTPQAVGQAIRSVSVPDGVTGEVYVAPGSNDRGGTVRLGLLNLQGTNVTAQQSFAVVGECLCDAAQDPAVVCHAYHGEVAWPPPAALLHGAV